MYWLLKWCMLFSICIKLSNTIKCEHCKMDGGKTDDCTKDAKDQIDCAPGIESCVITFAQIKNDTFYVDKRCGHKDDDAVNECHPETIEMDNGQNVNSTMCICHSDLCNEKTFSELKQRSVMGSSAPQATASMFVGVLFISTVFLLQ